MIAFLIYSYTCKYGEVYGKWKERNLITYRKSTIFSEISMWKLRFLKRSNTSFKLIFKCLFFYYSMPVKVCSKYTYPIHHLRYSVSEGFLYVCRVIDLNYFPIRNLSLGSTFNSNYILTCFFEVFQK